nr:Scr1 family TA system antitoxin-like transcriptional regulator [Amycolatopsis sp. WAC 01375]
MDRLDSVRAPALARCVAEEAAVTIRCYSGPNLPEMLMTPTVARLMWEWRAGYQPALAAVGAELSPRRRAVLKRASPPRLVFVVGEETLTRFEARNPDPDTAAEQLRSLRDDACDRHVSVLLHPLTAPALPWPAGRFTVTTGADGRHTAFVETLGPSGLLIVRDPEHIEVYLTIFAALRRDSVSEDASLVRIAETLPARQTAAATVSGDRPGTPMRTVRG